MNLSKRVSLIFTTLFFVLSSQCNALEYFVNAEYPGVLLVQGKFEPDDTVKLTSEVLSNQIHTIMLNSEGGNLVSSIEIGYFIREQKLNTLIPENGYCFSACTYAFMGGVERTIDGDAKFAMHRPFFNEEMPGNYNEGYNAGIITSVMVVVYLIEMGLDSLTASLHLINKQLAHFDQEQQKNLNIITTE
jgi:hypothetical protein